MKRYLSAKSTAFLHFTYSIISFLLFSLIYRAITMQRSLQLRPSFVPRFFSCATRPAMPHDAASANYRAAAVPEPGRCIISALFQTEAARSVPSLLKIITSWALGASDLQKPISYAQLYAAPSAVTACRRFLVQ